MPSLKGSDDSEFDEKTSFGKETASTISLAITKALNKLGTLGGYAVVLLMDDLQWMDATTLDITLDIVRRCPHVLIALVARPLEEIPAAMRAPFESLLEADHMTRIALEPLAVESGTAMIRYALKDIADAGGDVSDEVCNKIYQLGQGNPMVTRVVCEATKSDWQDSAAYMSGNAGLSSVKLNIPPDYTSAVIAQFDKVNASLQVILKVAAAGGQFFNIADTAQVLTLLDEFNGTPEDVYETIKEHDIFNFVTLSDTFTGTCSFSHFLIYQSILKSLVPTFVENVHLTFVNYYESIINDANQILLIPLLLYHLSGITGDTDRKRKYTRIAFTDAATNHRVAEAQNYHYALAELGPAENIDLADYIAHNYRLMSIYLAKGDAMFDLVKDSCRCVGFIFPSQKQKIATVALYFIGQSCGLASYLLSQYANAVTESLVMYLMRAALQMALVDDDSMYNIVVYSSVGPLVQIFYFELPPVAFSLMKGLPLIETKAAEMINRTFKEQLDFANACIVSVILNFTLGKFTTVLEVALQAGEADVYLHNECAEYGRVNRLFSVLSALFVGKFVDTRAVITAHLANYTVEDIGVKSFHDNYVHLCALMIQQGEWEASREIYVLQIREEYENDPKV
ncbi:Adenylate cyclase type 10 [Irineochytrium annulatum]|nr:Adenylate cyclase type 10 [Irineochytrium annulatum]